MCPLDPSMLHSMDSNCLFGHPMISCERRKPRLSEARPQDSRLGAKAREVAQRPSRRGDSKLVRGRGRATSDSQQSTVWIVAEFGTGFSCSYKRPVPNLVLSFGGLGFAVVRRNVQKSDGTCRRRSMSKDVDMPQRGRTFARKVLRQKGFAVLEDKVAECLGSRRERLCKIIDNVPAAHYRQPFSLRRCDQLMVKFKPDCVQREQ